MSTLFRPDGYNPMSDSGSEEERQRLAHTAAHRLALRASGMRASNREITKRQYDRYLKDLLENFNEFPKGVLSRIVFHPINNLNLGQALTLVTFLMSSGPVEVDDYIALRSLICDELDEWTETDTYVYSLRHYPRLSPPDVEGSDYPEERLIQAKALVRLHHHLRHEMVGNIEHEAQDGKEYFCVNDENLRDLLFDFDSIEEVTSIIMERNIMDPKDIAEIMSSQCVAAMGSGRL